MILLGHFHSFADNFHGVNVGPLLKDRDVNLVSNLLQLGDGSRPVNVGRDKHRAGVILILQPEG